MKVNERKIKNGLLLISIILVLGYSIYSFSYPKLKQKKQEGISWVITNFFEDDIVFFAELIPSFCDAENQLSLIFYNNEKSSLTYYPIKEKIDKDGVKYLVDIIRRAKRKLKNLHPKNDFHEKLKKNLISTTANINFQKLKSKNEDVSMEEYAKFYSEITLAFWKSGAEKYFESIIAEIDERENELPFLVRFSIHILGSDFDLSDEKYFLKIVNETAMKNQSYLNAYKNGCLELFISECNKGIEKNAKDKNRKKTKFEELLDDL